MGGSTSLERRVQDLEETGKMGNPNYKEYDDLTWVEDSKNGSNACDNLMGLPCLGSNRIIIGRELATEEEIKRSEAPIEVKKGNKDIASKALEALAKNEDVIIEEYDIITAVTLISMLSLS